MKTIVKIASVLLLALLVILPLQPVSAASGLFDGQVIFGQSFTLKSGETMTGDLLVFGGSATIEQGAIINGNVVVLGGSLEVGGEVTGDAVVMGGSASLSAQSHIHGNLSTVGSTLNRADGAQIDGQIYNTSTSWVGSNNNHPASPEIPIVPNIQFNPFGTLLSMVTAVWNALVNAVGIALLAMLLMLFLAPHADRVAHAVIAQPLTTGGLGLLTVIAAPIAIVIMSVTIILIPGAIIVAIALAIAALFGWIALGYEIGQRFTTAIHQTWHPAFSAGLGVFVLTLASRALTGIPVLNCVGWLIPFLLGLAAMGAVLMTRFGTQAVTAPGESTLLTTGNSSGQNSA